MAKKVLKFGGTSVGTIERILYVAKIIKREHDAGNEVIAVVSAMSGKTNELLKQSKTKRDEFEVFFEQEKASLRRKNIFK